MITNVLLGAILIVSLFNLIFVSHEVFQTELITSDINAIRRYIFDIKLDNRWSKKVK